MNDCSLQSEPQDSIEVTLLHKDWPVWKSNS